MSKQNGISWLSSTTVVAQCCPKVRKYLQSIGHPFKTIRKTPVFVMRRNGRVVSVAGSAEEIENKPGVPFRLISTQSERTP